MNYLTSYRIRFRDTANTIIMFALCVVLTVVVSAQGSKSKVSKEKANLTQITATQKGIAHNTPKGPGSDSGAPHLPAGFTDTRYVDIGSLRLHAVMGGKGRPLLLIHGWPQSWYQWRLVMPALARDFQVIAVDQRGIGLSDKPQGGYDSGTQANDLVKL